MHAVDACGKGHQKEATLIGIGAAPKPVGTLQSFLARSRVGPDARAMMDAVAPLFKAQPWLYIAAPIISILLLRWARKRWLTLRASSPTPVVSRLMANVVRAYKMSEDEFFAADGAPAEVQALRRRALDALAASFDAKVGPKAREYNEQLRGLSDIRFTDTNRVPHGFQPVIRSKLRLGFIAERSEGPYLVDVDGNKTLDVSGSYGVNVVGYDKYKEMTAAGYETVRALGPNVLGPLHPVIFDILKALRSVSRLPEASFHMSGTEAIMTAVRLARFNTRRRLIVQFAGAYHGWWDGVQPGPGNERLVHDTLTLKDLDPISLRLIAARADEIAAVLVSPLQGLNPGRPPPSDLVLMDAKVRTTADKDDKYKNWLGALRELCTSVGVPLVFDEVYTGFRMAPGGAQEYYGVYADMVCYGKTLGGGLPCGVVCGTPELMARFDPERPLRVSYVIGTFAAAPAVIGPMAAFLAWAATDKARKSYDAQTARVAAWVKDTNNKMIGAGYPLRVDCLTTVWTVLFTSPGRYHWMFQYYMRNEGLNLSWVGTGRCLFSLDFGAAEFEATQSALLRAAKRMRDDGWWWEGASAGAIKRGLVLEFAKAMFLPSAMLRSDAPSKGA